MNKNNKNLIYFVNGVDTCSIMRENLPKTFKIDTDICFRDMDTENLRRVLNYFRNCCQSDYKNKDILEYDITVFLNDVEKMEIIIGNTYFYTSKNTLLKLPYFQSFFNIQKEQTINIDRDPEFFKRILSHLRNPIEHPLEKFDDMLLELKYWGIEKGRENGLKFLKLEHQSTYNKLDKPHLFSTWFNTNPHVTFFINNYRRFTDSQNNIIVNKPINIEPKNPQEDKKINVLFESDSENWKYVDILNDMYLTFRTTRKIERLTDLFRKVNITITTKPVASTIKLTQSAEMMEIISELKYKESFIIHESNCIDYINNETIKYITVPLRFYFCNDLSSSFQFMNKEISLEVIDCDNEDDITLHSTTYLLTDDERNAMSSREHESFVEYQYKILQEPVHNGMIHKILNFEKDHMIKYIVFTITDTYGERIKCDLHGYIRIGDKKHFINPHINHMYQTKHSREHKNGLFFITQYENYPNSYIDHSNDGSIKTGNNGGLYNPYIWIISFAAGNLTNISQPTGMNICTNEIEIKLECSVLENVIINGWINTYNIYHSSNGLMGFVYQDNESFFIDE